jgi:hypothetical protein
LPMSSANAGRAGFGFLGVALLLLVVGLAPPAAAAAADLRAIGGNASSAIVCGNVAAAQQLAQQRKLTIQKSNCVAKSAAGNALLQNVDIYVSSAARKLHDNDPVLATLEAGMPPGVAQDRCENHRPNPGPGKQINKCWALARGGKVILNNVQLVNRRSDGSIMTRTIDSAAVPPGNGGTASAACANIVNDPLNQRDDCTGSGAGGAWSMSGVDVVVRNPDGTTSTRNGITVEVRGGNATAAMHCFNVKADSGGVVQINVCNADALGGDATLRNVTFHTSGISSPSA